MRRTNLFISAALVMMSFSACGGLGTSSSESNDDSITVAEPADTLVVTDTKTIGGVVETEETDADAEGEAKPATLNAALFGKYSNHKDPLINLVVSDKLAKHDDSHSGYGYIEAYNDYFESEFTLVFTSITPDGDNIKVHYNKMEMSYDGGDPDDFGAEDYGDWTEEKTGEGDLTLIPAGNGKVRVDSKEGRIKNVVLSK